MKINIIILILLSTILVFLIFHKYQVSQVDSNINSKLDSFKLKIDSINLKKDSIINKIGVSKTIINNINHWYEKEADVITNQSTDSDVVFFSRYLSKENQ